MTVCKPNCSHTHTPALLPPPSPSPILIFYKDNFQIKFTLIICKFSSLTINKIIDR